MQKRMADGFPAVVAELNSLVLSIAEQIAHLHLVNCFNVPGGNSR
jgi:hypothetical protein